jgi:hypothetical protein
MTNMNIDVAKSLKIKYEKFYSTLTEEEQKLFIDAMIVKAMEHMIEKGLIEIL